MAKQVLSHVMDLSLTGTAFTDSLFVDVGASAFSFRELKEGLGHDFFIQEYLIIRSASGGGGTLLVESTDYTLSEEDILLSNEVTKAINDGTTYHVYKKCQITNASYQSGNIYVSGKWVADGVDSSFYNCATPIVVSKSASYTITDTDYYTHYLVTAGTATKTITLPTVADNKNLRIKITKIDSGYGPVLVDGEGSETINGLTHIFLWSQYDCIELMSTGTEWIIINDFRPYFYSGWISRSDWTNVHMGFATIIYDTPSSADPFIIGDKIAGANGSYGICIYHNTTTLVIANCVSVGVTVFANNEALTGDLSGATALVNMASGLKNVDSNIYHGYGKNIRNVNIKAWWSPDGAENTGTELGANESRYDSGSLAQHGLRVMGVDINNVLLHSEVNGVLYLDNSGSEVALTNQDDYYNIYIQLLAY